MWTEAGRVENYFGKKEKTKKEVWEEREVTSCGNFVVVGVASNKQ